MKRIWYLFAFVVLLDSSVAAQPFRWGQSLKQPNKSWVTAVSVDKDGNIYTLGYQETHPERLFGFHTSGEIFLSKRDTNGNEMWIKHFGGNACAYDMTVDAANHVVICGGFFDSLLLGPEILRTHSFGASFIASFEPSGNILWARKDTSEANSLNISINTDAKNNIFITGIDYDIDGFFAKFDANGKTIWKKYAQGVRTFDDIVTDDAGNIYVAGTCNPEAKFDSISVPELPGMPGYVTFIAQYDPDAKAKWLHADPFGTFTIANQLALSSWGTIIRYRYATPLADTKNVEVYSTTGELGTVLEFSSAFGTSDQFLQNTLAATKPFGVFIAEAKNDSIIIHRFRLIVTPDTIRFFPEDLARISGKYLYAQAIAADANDVYLAGSFIEPELRLGNISVTNSNDALKFDNDLFLTQIKSDGSLLGVAKKSAVNSGLAIYPNPCTDFITISSEAALLNAEIEIENLLGETVCVSTMTNTSVKINVSAFPAGIYTAIVKTKEGLSQQRFIRN